VTADGDYRVAVLCKAQCTEIDKELIEKRVKELAWPSPAYVQDIEVHFAAAATIAQKLNSATPPTLGVTADFIGIGRIRLKSDTRLSDDDATALITQYIFSLPPPPDFRLFYQGSNLVQPVAVGKPLPHNLPHRGHKALSVTPFFGRSNGLCLPVWIFALSHRL
jgi:hypothetical protein